MVTVHFWCESTVKHMNQHYHQSSLINFNNTCQFSGSRRVAVQATGTDAGRRDLLIASMGCCSQIAALGLLSASKPYAASAVAVPDSNTSNRSSTGGSQPVKDPMFYARWPYASPADILPYIKQEAVQGDSQSVLDAMDAFSLYYPQYKIGPEKGVLFEHALSTIKPRLALELGTFLGYSAIRAARNLAPGGQLICVEANPDNAAVARQLLEFAGVPAGQVLVVEGLASQVIPRLPLLLQQQKFAGQTAQGLGKEQEQLQGRFDVVFLDHSKNDYLPDLQRLEQLGLVRGGTAVIADNVIYPGAPGFLEYLDSSGRYQTKLLKAKYEYEQAWNPDWEPGKEDAMSLSVCLTE